MTARFATLVNHSGIQCAEEPDPLPGPSKQPTTHLGDCRQERRVQLSCRLVSDRILGLGLAVQTSANFFDQPFSVRTDGTK